MFPMLEMSGQEHYRFMKDINYVYNEQNPLNDMNRQMEPLALRDLQLVASSAYLHHQQERFQVEDLSAPCSNDTLGV